jgi:hypothetical protein
MKLIFLNWQSGFAGSSETFDAATGASDKSEGSVSPVE